MEAIAKLIMLDVIRSHVKSDKFAHQYWVVPMDAHVQMDFQELIAIKIILVVIPIIVKMVDHVLPF